MSENPSTAEDTLTHDPASGLAGTDPVAPSEPDGPFGADPEAELLGESMPHPSEPSVTPFLMFEGDAGAAMDLYLAAFAGTVPARELRRDLFDASSPRGEEWAGKVSHGEIEVAGQRLRFFDSFAPHGFTFTPAISLFLDVAAPEDVDTLAAALKDGGGQDYMPAGDYGFSRRFAWVGDRFGVTWQINTA